MRVNLRLCSVLFAFAVLKTCSASEINDETAKEIQTVLFAPEGAFLEPIQPTRTLELLKQLRDYYESQSSKESIEMKKRLDMLISVSIGKKEKCERRTMILFWQSIIKTYFSHSLNIVPYIRIYRLKQFLACKDILAENLAKDVAKLRHDQASDLGLFREIFVQCGRIGDLTTIINWPYYYDPFEELRCTIKGFVQQKATHLKGQDKSRMRELIRNEVEKVSEMCSSLQEASNSSIEGFNVYMYNLNPGLFGQYDLNEFQKKIDQVSLEWIVSSKICDKVFYDKGSLLEAATNAIIKGESESAIFWFKDNSDP